MLVVVEVGVLNPGQQLVDTRSGRRIRIARRWRGRGLGWRGVGPHGRCHSGPDLILYAVRKSIIS